MMIRKLVAVALLCLGVAACGSAPSPASPGASVAAGSSAAGAAATSSAAGQTQVPAPAAGTAGTSALNAAAQAEQEQPANGAPDSTAAELERVATLPPQGRLPSGPWAAGTNYRVIVPAQPTAVQAGKVEVMEVFWYGCPHCFALEPYIDAWLAHKPSYVQFVRVPVIWNDATLAHARLFYTLRALGKVDALHDKAFDAIHEQGDPLFVQGDPSGTQQEQLAFAQANGITKTAFLDAYNSFGVQTNLQKASELDRRYQIDAVPTVIVNGQYETDVGMAGGESQLIQLIDFLAASEHKR